MINRCKITVQITFTNRSVFGGVLSNVVFLWPYYSTNCADAFWTSVEFCVKYFIDAFNNRQHNFLVVLQQYDILFIAKCNTFGGGGKGGFLLMISLFPCFLIQAGYFNTSTHIVFLFVFGQESQEIRDAKKRFVYGLMTAK